MTLQAILIAGPTASGKSALAAALAREIGGVIVNADSMQVYRDLRVITARPTLEEERAAPHRLFGHVDAAINYSVGKWLADFAATLAALPAGATPVVVGGTGMYFKAALYGLSDIPPTPQEVRAAVRGAAQGKTAQQLHAELAARDPLTAARLRHTDPQRILRALEVFAATGKPLASFQGARGATLLDPTRCPAFFLVVERAELYARIDARFDRMISRGALDEVAALRARGLDPNLPAMRAHGVPGLNDYLAGRATLDDAIARGKSDTRHYAKRQFTFARHQLPGFRQLVGDDPERLAREALNARAETGSRTATERSPS